MTHKYYVRCIAPNRWEVVNSETGVSFYTPSRYGDDEPVVFGSFEEAQVCCNRMNEEEK